MRCCLETPDPGPWTAGVDDSADPEMVQRMHDIRNRMRTLMSTEELVQSLRQSASIDSRTWLGGDIQRCLCSIAAHRLTVLELRRDPDAAWRGAGMARLRDAWEVLTGRAVAIGVGP